jgi:hypothetical protein
MKLGPFEDLAGCLIKPFCFDVLFLEFDEGKLRNVVPASAPASFQSEEA